MKNFVSKFLLWSEPIVKLVDHIFTVPFTHKKITGDHYYLWRDQISPGQVLLTQTFGAGSNLLNPSEINHSAIYFGRGLLSASFDRIEKLNASSKRVDHKTAIRIEKAIIKYNIKDEICYVIEAVGKGVIPTNLVKFLTTKDIVKVCDPKFADDAIRSKAICKAIDDFGLPYDYAFSDRDNAKYCFELCADAYEKVKPGLELRRKHFTFLGMALYETYLADTFLDETHWECTIDSKLQS